MELKALSLSDIEQVRQWRNEQLEMLRTPFSLTKEMQENFYHEVICNRQANSRYWGIWHEDYFLGMVGIENIQWENRLGEISLILEPNGNVHILLEDALKLILDQGFNYLNLENIYTEVYYQNENILFWEQMNVKFNNDINGESDMIILPNRKYYNGLYHNSIYINFNKERYNESIISKST